jgi:hypothetical protein
MEGQGECAECVALAREMQANDEVLWMLREEALPPAVIRMPKRHPVYVCVAVAAAAVLAIAVAPILRHRSETPKSVAAVKSRPAAEPLMVRIMTPDPEVVILWQIDPEGEASQ